MKFDTWLLEESGIQLIDGDRGKNYPNQANFKNSGYCLFLSAKNVTRNGFDFSEQIFIDKQTDELLRAGKLSKSDIIVTTRGTIGNVALYDETIQFQNVRINSGMMILRINKEIWNKRFLYFLLTSDFVQQQIISLTSGSAVPQLPARDLKKFVFPKISLCIQNNIVKVIGCVSDKILLNQEINKTLEQIAQAIFKSWFVDFEPTKAKIAALEVGGTKEDATLAAMTAISGKSDDELEKMHLENPEEYESLRSTADLFPSELEENELGLIPKGWGIQRAEDVIELCYGKALIKTDRKVGDYPVYGSGGVNGTHNQSIVNGPGIIIGRKGTVGSIYWEDKSFYPIDTVFFVKCKSKMTLPLALYVLKNLGLEHMNTDAAVPGLNRNNVYRLEIPKYPIQLINLFTNFIFPFRKKMKLVLEETHILTKIRDGILPKLLSGEIDFSILKK